MSYGPNLLINPDAETGDTTGWDAVNVTVVGGTIPVVALKHKIGDSGGWMDSVTPQLAFEGLDGTHYFNLAPEAVFSQTVLAADIGVLPDFDFEVDLDFKLSSAQELEDATVKGWLEVEILYSDESTDLYVIPCVVGIVTTERELFNYWLRATANCFLRANLGLTSITITVRTMEA